VCKWNFTLYSGGEKTREITSMVLGLLVFMTFTKHRTMWLLHEPLWSPIRGEAERLWQLVKRPATS
jgi:hypothetical protein